MRTLVTLAAVAPLSLVSMDALAGPHHTGLMMRLALGGGGAVAEADAIPDFELSGSAGFFSLDVGGSLAPRLALHGRISGHSLVDPTVSIDGRELGEAEDSSIVFRLFGLGITYYFPSNVYLTGVIGASSATLEVAGEKFESDTGVGLAADAGYEWWVGGDWGLGVSGRFEFHSVPADPERVVAKALGVLFTATYH